MKKQLSALLAAALCAGALAGCGANSNSANAATSGAEDAALFDLTRRFGSGYTEAILALKDLDFNQP